MPQIGSTARVSLAGSTGVEANAPLEDLSQEIYRVVRRYAELNGFEPFVYPGPYAPVKGLKGPLVMAQIVRRMFPEWDDDTFRKTSGLINQVLKKTEACICIRRPSRSNGKVEISSDNMPIWFVADKMPDNIVVVALSHSRRSVELETVTPHGEFDEGKFLTPRERRLRDEEVERPPGEVTVTTTDTEDKSPSTKNLDEGRERKIREHEILLQRIFDELSTNPVPLTAGDIHDIINDADGASWNISTIRFALRELLDKSKIVSRTETRDEAKIRGGGKIPKATRPLLYAPAPGPVPDRHRLPDGIKPVRGAADWSAEASETMAAESEKIMAILNSRDEDGNMIRNLRAISERAGLPRRRALLVLGSMQAAGKVYTRHSRWYPVTVPKRKPRPGAPERSVLPTEETVDMVQPAPAAPEAAPDPGNLQLVLTLAAALGVELPSGDAEERERLTQELESAGETITKLQARIKALQAAVASFGE